MVKFKKNSKYFLSNKHKVQQRGVEGGRFIAYEGDDYYVTIPFIDKISLLGNPGPNQNNRHYITAKLNAEAQKTENQFGKNTFSTHPMTKEEAFKARYRERFKLFIPCADERVYIFTNPARGDMRNFKMEFNPQKLGQEGISFLVNWYNSVIEPSSTNSKSPFHDLISADKCITRLDIAIDIVGTEFDELILSSNKGETVRWHSNEGTLQTYYLDAKKKETG